VTREESDVGTFQVAGPKKGKHPRRLAEKDYFEKIPIFG
jgi:hypothetical protein